MPADPQTDLHEGLERTDRIINRFVGIVVVLTGIAIAFSSVFTDFQQRVLYQWEFVDGEREPVFHITCPSPWSVLAHDAKPDAVVSGEVCVRPARAQVIQGVFSLLLALPLGIWVFTRDTRRARLPELPPSLRARL